MTDEVDGMNLTERVRLIESMIAEGRRSTSRWGWSFVLWGVAYYVATAWAVWAKTWLAWPVTMIGAGLLCSVLAARVMRGQPVTMLGRAIGGAWAAMGVSLLVVLMCLGIAGRCDGHFAVAIIGAMLATVNATSAIILKWKVQFACAVVWLAAGVAACFGSDTVVWAAFLGATFLCQIVFGIYAMVLESRRRHVSGVAHA